MLCWSAAINLGGVAVFRARPDNPAAAPRSAGGGGGARGGALRWCLPAAFAAAIAVAATPALAGDSVAAAAPGPVAGGSAPPDARAAAQAHAAMAPPAGPPPLAPVRAQRNWAFFPGVYHRYGANPVGFEVTALYRGLGLALGGEPGVRYAEAELGVYFLAAGIGPRVTRDGVGTQWTIALPLLPLIPYARTLVGPAGHRGEFGLMLKVPLFGFARMEGVL